MVTALGNTTEDSQNLETTAGVNDFVNTTEGSNVVSTVADAAVVGTSTDSNVAGTIDGQAVAGTTAGSVIVLTTAIPNGKLHTLTTSQRSVCQNDFDESCPHMLSSIHRVSSYEQPKLPVLNSHVINNVS